MYFVLFPDLNYLVDIIKSVTQWVHLVFSLNRPEMAKRKPIYTIYVIIECTMYRMYNFCGRIFSARNVGTKTIQFFPISHRKKLTKTYIQSNEKVDENLNQIINFDNIFQIVGWPVFHKVRSPICHKIYVNDNHTEDWKWWTEHWITFQARI